MPEYIEREAMLEAIHMARNQLTIGKTAAAKLEKMVKSAPTADVDPVVHAHWVFKSGPWGRKQLSCSHCGHHSGLLGKRDRCPNCGAHMDEEGGDDHAAV